jgi:hypothetical protein
MEPESPLPVMDGYLVTAFAVGGEQIKFLSVLMFLISLQTGILLSPLGAH